MDYSEWNTAIAHHFFNVDKGGNEVLLFVNEKEINVIGSMKKSRVTDFIGAMKTEAESTKGHVCKRALQLFEGWRETGCPYPPYIAYLALFVLAATTEGDFDPKAYYPRFWQLINEPGEGAPAGFYETANLWDDLEKWSVEDKKEELGRFKSRIRGKWCHVGRPLSQTLLSDDERENLPRIFFDCGFDPTNIPSEEIIKSGLIRQGPKRLRHRTLTLLKSQEKDNQEFVNALLELVITELEEWGKYEPTHPIDDGRTKDALPTEKERKTPKPIPSLFFRTCIELDHPKQHANISLRLKTARPYPENGLDFKVDGKTLTCLGTIPIGWSTKLMELPSNTPFDPSRLNWLQDWKFSDVENGWNVTYKRSSVRVFLPGDEEDIPAFIESQKLSRDCEFRVLCHESMVMSIRDWGRKSCKSFSELVYTGIPSGWTLFKGIGATESCQGIDVLGLSNLVRIQLEGGIGIGRSNLYLCFAPPRIKVDGGQGNEKLLLNGIEIEKSSSSICWTLPRDAPIGRPLNIQISRDGALLPESRVIQLIEPFINARSAGLAPKRDRKGDVIKGKIVSDFVTGALVSSPKYEDIESPRVLPTSLSERLIFIGQVVGQVSDWPSEDIPSLWTPVWVVYKTSRKKWATHFCMQKLSDDLAPIERKGYSARNLKAWKKAIWTMRKRTRPPKLPALTELWAKYMAAAKNV